MGTRMTRIKRIYTDLICGNPLNPRHLRSYCDSCDRAEGSEQEG
ncbi:hypothetical protein Halhy_4886 [Haliscomenobacter hydrossis DSM 1100]|uniref:Uncharacterized protein n=1 Tax=Haliscomenobacter hydrossis (strain ATCC 27775 / DSM 1100 / LMG 10767 / O) TaxID=760192 RepID=F4L007_HALH1|nr:hypothetical protein Halhy_4886 [Haliscomenobacter hydrossis DSM 1100]